MVVIMVLIFINSNWGIFRSNMNNFLIDMIIIIRIQSLKFLPSKDLLFIIIISLMFQAEVLSPFLFSVRYFRFISFWINFYYCSVNSCNNYFRGRFSIIMVTFMMMIFFMLLLVVVFLFFFLRTRVSFFFFVVMVIFFFFISFCLVHLDNVLINNYSFFLFVVMIFFVRDIF